MEGAKFCKMVGIFLFAIVAVHQARQGQCSITPGDRVRLCGGGEQACSGREGKKRGGRKLFMTGGLHKIGINGTRSQLMLILRTKWIQMEHFHHFNQT